ncbi:MAG: response regulator [Sediminibacterium sp.]
MNDNQNSETREQEDNIGKRILIFDDDQEILTMCTIVLKKFNYQVKTLSRCENVIMDIDNYKPDLILMDLWIPEIGGEKAVQLVKGNSKSSHIPVLLFSANSDISDICIRANADGFITKPFKLNIFRETIEKHIQISQPK